MGLWLFSIITVKTDISLSDSMIIHCIYIYMEIHVHSTLA